MRLARDVTLARLSPTYGAQAYRRFLGAIRGRLGRGITPASGRGEGTPPARTLPLAA